MSGKNILKLDKVRTVEAKVEIEERNTLVCGLYGIWAILGLWFSSSLLVVFSI